MQLDSAKVTGRSLEGSEYIAGVVGLNNLKKTEFANCIIQILCRVKPLRDKCLMSSKNDLLTIRFDELVRKIWNP